MNFTAIIEFAKLMGALGIKEGCCQFEINVHDAEARLKVGFHRSPAAIEWAKKNCPEDGVDVHEKNDRCHAFTSWTWIQSGIEFVVYN